MLSMADLWQYGPMGMHAFWIWLTFGVVLLVTEVFLGTQWLLWSATAAGVVAVACLTGVPVGAVGQVAIFAVLSLIMTLLTRRFLKISVHSADINDQHLRLAGKYAQVLSGFESGAGERTGRVIFDGVEWPAVLEPASEAPLSAQAKVIIERVHEGRLYVRAA